MVENNTDIHFQMNLIDLEEAKGTYTQILTQFIETEEILHEKRLALHESDNFDCYYAFTRITDEIHGGITIDELTSFLKKYDEKLQQKWIKILVLRCDQNNDGIISWPEFQDFILNRENHDCYDYGHSSKHSKFFVCEFEENDHVFDFTLEKSLAGIFLTEIEGLKKQEALRRKMVSYSENLLQRLFEAIDLNKKGILNEDDIHMYLRENTKSEPDYTKTAHCFKILDHTIDGEIEYNEFLRSLLPYSEFQKRNLIPTQANIQFDQNQQIDDHEIEGTYDPLVVEKIDYEEINCLESEHCLFGDAIMKKVASLIV